MRWIDRFAAFEDWNLWGWLIVCAVWTFWEIWGATHKEAATFTYLIRNTIPKWAVLIVWLVLGWHFLWYDAKWWKTLMSWFPRLG